MRGQVPGNRNAGAMCSTSRVVWIGYRAGPHHSSHFVFLVHRWVWVLDKALGREANGVFRKHAVVPKGKHSDGGLGVKVHAGAAARGPAILPSDEQDSVTKGVS